MNPGFPARNSLKISDGSFSSNLLAIVTRSSRGSSVFVKKYSWRDSRVRIRRETIVKVLNARRVAKMTKRIADGRDRSPR
jgi:hypothetical protein